MAVELQMRLAWRLDDDGQQVPGGVNEARPELNEGQILQMREAPLEFLDHLFDDEGPVICGREKGG
jgi:hypothetical protein